MPGSAIRRLRRRPAWRSAPSARPSRGPASGSLTHMIASIRHETMRHIPEEELHAYLDQALSRAQCVEIESHLAACAGCSEARDGIAALRDRTTALLASLAPPRGFPPILDNLRAEAAAR